MLTIALAWPSDDDSLVKLLGWWYICIGLAFIALAARAFVAGIPTWSAWLRVAIAVGFVLLGIFELRRRRS
jgi:threonine/homoserine/homoserine lactone efflux protein